MRSLARSAKPTAAQVDRLLTETEGALESELEEERDVLKALQVRIVLEDASQLGAQRLDVMEDELERYRDYRQYADAGVQSAWDTLESVVEDVRHPPKLDDGTLLRELRVATAQVLNLECDSSSVKTLLRRTNGVAKLRVARDALEAEFERMMGSALAELRETLGGFELRRIDEVLRKYSNVGEYRYTVLQPGTAASPISQYFRTGCVIIWERTPTVCCAALSSQVRASCGGRAPTCATIAHR